VFLPINVLVVIVWQGGPRPEPLWPAVPKLREPDQSRDSVSTYCTSSPLMIHIDSLVITSSCFQQSVWFLFDWSHVDLLLSFSLLQ
jgi:hypothetical protein